MDRICGQDQVEGVWIHRPGFEGLVEHLYAGKLRAAPAGQFAHAPAEFHRLDTAAAAGKGYGRVARPTANLEDAPALWNTGASQDVIAPGVGYSPLAAA
jgi:hypothetical protein